MPLTPRTNACGAWLWPGGWLLQRLSCGEPAVAEGIRTDIDDDTGNPTARSVKTSRYPPEHNS